MNDPSEERPVPICQFEANSVTEGRLRVGPLPRRTAESFGSALRRTLLREVQSACVSAVRIEGGMHEFAPLEGVCEDVLRIVENLRKAPVALRGLAPTTVSVTAVGPRTVTAADLARPDAVTTSTPDHVIATVNEGGRLEMTVEISRGTGYQCAEQVRQRRPGWIEIDRDYSPLDRVAMKVEGEGSDAVLCLEVIARGTVSPAEAMVQAACLLQSKPGLEDQARDLCRSAVAAAEAPVQRPAAPAPRPAARIRVFSKAPADFPIPDLTGLQRQSYEWFAQLECQRAERRTQGLEKLFRDVFPVRLAGGEGLAYAGYELGGAEMSPGDCLRFGNTYAAPLRLSLRRPGGGQPLTIEVCRLPLMTGRGTFIISGREKAVLGRLQADEDTQYNDLTTRRLFLVGLQLEAALSEPLAADADSIRKLRSPADLALPGFAQAVKDFFRRGRFVRRAETTNPLALASQLRRVVQCGIECEPGYDARGVCVNHFGRLCLLETPEGDKIGLNLGLGILAGVDEEGRLLTPYRKTGSGAIELVSPAAEAGMTIADLAAGDAYRTRYGGRLLGKSGDEIVRIDASGAEYVPVHPSQALGASASLIPFVGHDDPNRALMGTNMQKQAVPLLDCEPPLVRTGLETRVVEDARVSVKAESDGVVSRVTADGIVVLDPGSGGRRTYPLTRIAGSPDGACLRQRPLVRPGEKIVKGQVIADGAATDQGVLALGRTVLVGYLPWEGYNFEDSIVISDRLVRQGTFTSIKAQAFVTTIAVTDAGVEKLGADHLPTEEAAKLSPSGVVSEGQAVEGGDVLVAKARRTAGPDGKESWQDASLRTPAGQRGTVVKVEHYAASRADPVERGVSELVRVTVAARRRLKIGDKLANRHGAKGTVGLIVPEDEMPVLPDGRALDVILDPLGVPSRMNIGQLLETHLGLAAHELNCTVITPGFGGASVEDIGALLAEAGLPASGMFRLRDGRTGRLFDHESTVGCQYVMKLVHMVDDRCQARCRGEYSEATQQPVGGRRQAGGQHVGIMETWSLQAHAAGHTLHELLTVQSDDVSARDRAYEALLSGAGLPRATVPHSVKRLVSQLRGLCLDLRLFGADGREVDVFHPGSSVEEAVEAGVEFASPDTVRRWSAGELSPARQDALFDELFGPDDGLAVKHVELAAPVKHPWRTAVGRAAGLPEIAAMPILPRSLRGDASLDEAYLAVCAANDAVLKSGRTPEALASLQAAVDRLIGDPNAGGGLTRLLRGKRGWMTAAISGKTVDYSARSVVCPGCDLSYDECGLPMSVAGALFEPFVLGELMRAGLAASPDAARRMLHDGDPRAVEALRRVAADRFVLLHRAPALHRLSIQAFRPKITDEDVIRIHPLTARAFNADFDGDEMDVYLPLSRQAQAEAAGAMRSSMCQLAPADGSYMNFPSQDMVFGCYYATRAKPEATAHARPFATADDASAAFEQGRVGVHDPILLGAGEDARRTTVGRALFNRLLPRELGWVEEPVTNALLRRLFLECWRRFGPDASARLGDAVMRFGFHHATLSGLSLGKDVLMPSARAAERLAEAWAKAEQLEARRQRGEIGADELYDALLDHWLRVAEEMTGEALTELASDRGGFNALHVMLASGARGNRLQARQLIALRGLMTMPTGRIAPTAFTANFLRGHSPLEYLASTFGARRGLADTALKTAEAGSLFKRIMNAVQDVVISQEDCGAADGVVKQAIREGDREVVSLAERIFGRVALEDVRVPGNPSPLVESGGLIGKEAAERIAAGGAPSVIVRSPLTCRAGRGLCAKCYGMDLSTWRLAASGLPAGVIAAQSIGEPMTQLTMRTFHPGIPVGRTSAGRQDSRESIIGGLPRLERLFEAGKAPGGEPGQRQALLEMLRAQGAAATAEHLLSEIHKVYRRQGVRIDDRHYEIVLREMLRPVRVTDPGDTALDRDEIVSADRLEAANSATSGRKASAEPTIVGVTEAAAATADFFAAAASPGGALALAKAAARRQKVRLQGIRNCTALGKPAPRGVQEHDPGP